MSAPLARLVQQPAVRAFVFFAVGVVAGDRTDAQAMPALVCGACAAALALLVLLARPWRPVW